MKISEGKWNEMCMDVYHNFCNHDIKSISSGMVIHPGTPSELGHTFYEMYFKNQLSWKSFHREGDIEFRRRVEQEEWKLQKEIHIGLLQEAIDL